MENGGKFHREGGKCNNLNWGRRLLLASCSFDLLNFFRFNTSQLAAENWGCGGFVPPPTQRFQGEIFNTPELAPGILYYLLKMNSSKLKYDLFILYKV
jgi:hypothetical protein